MEQVKKINMVDHDTFQLVNLSTGEAVARLDRTQVEELKKYLEIDSLTDTSFYITRETIDYLSIRDAHNLADVLATVLRDRDGMPVGYAPITTGPGSAHGRLLTLETTTPITGYKVEVYDEDVAFDDILGWCYSNNRGEFEARFDEADFKDSAPPDFERKPEVKLRISNVDGEELEWIGIIRAMDADFGDVFISAGGKLIAPVLDPTAAAICPQCGALYRAGFSTCSDDQTPLRPLVASRRPSKNSKR